MHDLQLPEDLFPDGWFRVNDHQLQDINRSHSLKAEERTFFAMIFPVGTCKTLSTCPPAPAPKSPTTLKSSALSSPNSPTTRISRSFEEEEEEDCFFGFVERGLRGAEERDVAARESEISVVVLEGSFGTAGALLIPVFNSKGRLACVGVVAFSPSPSPRPLATVGVA